MGIGDAEAPDATITESYDDGGRAGEERALPRHGVHDGKVKIAGNMGMLLGLQNVLALLPGAMAAIDVEY